MADENAAKAPYSVSCDVASVNELRAHDESLRRDISWFDVRSHGLSGGCGFCVVVFRVGEASGLLASRDGRVDDEQVRVDLSAAIDEASKVRDDAKAGVKDLEETAQALSDAMGRVSGGRSG